MAAGLGSVLPIIGSWPTPCGEYFVSHAVHTLNPWPQEREREGKKKKEDIAMP